MNAEEKSRFLSRPKPDGRFHSGYEARRWNGAALLADFKASSWPDRNWWPAEERQNSGPGMEMPP